MPQALETDRLPAPGPEELARSRALSARIRAEIEAAGGSIGLEGFLQQALYAPGLGYYSGGLSKFGATGDFVTAPELSPLFSRCLARQCGQVLEALGGGEVLEVGAGSGVMAAELLLALDRLGLAPRRYRILELSGELRARQRQTLSERAPALAGRVEWLERPPEAPIRGLVLANEVLDAIPFRRLRLEGDGVWERLVGWEEDRFVWRERPIREPSELAGLGAVLEVLGHPPAAYLTELAPARQAWLRAMAATLEAGAVLLIDYGYPRAEYYHPRRVDGTLRCHYRHRAHADPLVLVGLQDITAHVDFTAIAESALEVGLHVAGYTSQAQFLLALGIVQDLEAHGAAPGVEYLELASQVKRLTTPGEMGEAFKVMALTRGIDAPLAGFALHDRRARL